MIKYIILTKIIYYVTMDILVIMEKQKTIFYAYIKSNGNITKEIRIPFNKKY